MLKKSGIMLLLLFTGLGALCAQSIDAEESGGIWRNNIRLMPMGLEVDVNLDFLLLGVEKNTKTDVNLRRYAGDYKPQMIYGPGSRTGDWISDAGFSVHYNGGFFGGTLGVGTTVKENRIEYTDPVGKFHTLKAWVMPFGKWFKFTAGVGIGAGYADSLGAELGMRIYNGVRQETWNADRDPDNITQDQGVLLEGFIGPFSLALAGRYYNPTVFALNLNPTVQPENERNTQWAYKNEREFSYGLRIGSEIGQWGKVNASYVAEFTNYYESQQNFYDIDRDGTIVPKFGNTETITHLFGLYASLTPMDDVGVSLSYNGIVTKYLDEFYSGGNWHETTKPVVYQQAINLNLRYTGINRWTFRTDHNISFWTDMNYGIFGISAIGDMGIVSKSQSAGLADVDHLLMWNGLGASYQLTDTWKLDLYIRNLYRRDTALDVQADKDEFRFERDELHGELKGTWQPTSNLEFYAGLVLENKGTNISKDVHKRLLNDPKGFISLDAVNDTRDTTFLFKVPVGIIIRMR